MTHILIIEDEPKLAQLIVQYIARESYAYTHLADGLDVLPWLAQQQTDLILLDINLPDGNGIEFCVSIKQEFPKIGIIALSTFNQAGIINKMLENGADSYLLKNASSEELIEAIEKVSSGKKFLTPEIKKILSNNLSSNYKTPVFTKREKEVLALIAEGLTNQEIADKLFISQLTVISHRKSLLEKTESKNTAQLIKYCFEFGLL